jgi:hypothetical protein
VQGEHRLVNFETKDLYDSIVFDKLSDAYFEVRFSKKGQRYEKYLMNWLKKPHRVSYDYYARRVIEGMADHPDFIPCIDPDFDHSPRSGYKGVVLDGSTPDKWCSLLKNVLYQLDQQHVNDKMIFIKAWNEWGEGNYLEPDRKWGTAYLDKTREALIGI